MLGKAAVTKRRERREGEKEVLSLWILLLMTILHHMARTKAAGIQSTTNLTDTAQDELALHRLPRVRSTYILTECANPILEIAAQLSWFPIP